jgi:hypothetical protein
MSRSGSRRADAPPDLRHPFSSNAVLCAQKCCCGRLFDGGHAREQDSLSHSYRCSCEERCAGGEHPRRKQQMLGGGAGAPSA